MSFTDICFAAGFGSVRQFNDTIAAVFDSTPTRLRSGRRAVGPARGSDSGSITLRLPTRAPFAGDELMVFLGAHAVDGVEAWDGHTFSFALGLPGGPGVVSLRAPADSGSLVACHVEATVRLTDWGDLAAAVQRTRRLLDLDVDPEVIDDALTSDPVLARLVARVPGRRASASADPVQTALRAVIGQQVSLAGARTVTGRLVRALGDPLPPGLADGTGVTHVFPTVERLAAAPDELFAMPTARRDTVRRVAAAVAEGEVVLDAAVDPDEARERLLALKGVGPWTADYVLMRGLGHPDVFLRTDLVAVNALTAQKLDVSDTARWAPWRSYALHHVWASLDTLGAAAESAARKNAVATGVDAIPTSTDDHRRRREPR